MNDVISTDQERWEAITSRDAAAEGAFFYGVVTTGVYCRPACASRLPNRENVRFFDTIQAAEQAGFRPCKRCQPRSPEKQMPHAGAIIEACRLMDESEEPPSLAELAAFAGLSPSYFHRLFKEMVGLTPKQYALERRSDRMRATLAASSTVTEAIYEAGFASGSRFYQDATATLGMKPAAYRAGGQGMRIRFAIEPCYLGWVLIAATDMGICAIEFADEPRAPEERLRARFPQADLTEGGPDFAAWVARLLAYLEAPQDALDLPLDIQGTAFQRRVWQALRDIPPGSTSTYGQIAARIGNPRAARAVAGACASNAIAVAIPCHRVVRGVGGLGGYRWGIERKRALLETEATERGK